MRARPIALLLVAAVVAGSSGCGTDEAGTALAIRSTRWNPSGRLVATTECAEIERASVVGTEVWITGQPNVGRCSPEVVLLVPPGTRSVTDAATGTVVDLPPRPAT